MKKYLPAAAALVTAIAGWIISYRAVYPDLVEREPVMLFGGAGQFRFVLLVSIGGAVIAYWIVRRILFGPKLEKEAWAIYRAPGPVHLDRQALLERLRRYGYEPTVVDDAERAPDRLVLRHARRRHGSVIIDLGPLADNGWATIEASDPGGELYAEMARFTLLELGRLIPGMTYRGDTSALTPESTETLEPQLPDRPHALR